MEENCLWIGKPYALNMAFVCILIWSSGYFIFWYCCPAVFQRSKKLSHIRLFRDFGSFHPIPSHPQLNHSWEGVRTSYQYSQFLQVVPMCGKGGNQHTRCYSCPWGWSCLASTPFIFQLWWDGWWETKWRASTPLKGVTQKLHTSLRLSSLWPALCNMARPALRETGKYAD